jgi:hypothetical protein
VARTEGEAVTITAAQLGYLLEGIDWRLPQHTWRPRAAGLTNATRRLGIAPSVACASDQGTNGDVVVDAPLPDDVETLKAMLLAEREAYRAELREQGPAH